MELSPLFAIRRYTFWIPQHPEMGRRDTKLSFEIKFVHSNDGCIFPSEIPGHQPDYMFWLLFLSENVVDFA